MVSTCPRCAHPLVDVRRGDQHVFACKACGGVWMGGTTLDTFVRALEARPRAQAAVEHVTKHALFNFSVDPDTVECPVCRETMDAVRHAQGVTLDVCASHGVWFDRDELTHVLSGAEGRETARVARQRVRPDPAWSPGVGERTLDTLGEAAHNANLVGVEPDDVVWLVSASAQLAGSAVEALGGLAAGAVELVFEVLSSLDPT